MKCLNCGCESEHFLCPSCRTEDHLDKVFFDLLRYQPETCENPFVAEYAAGLTEKYAEREIIPEILDLFDFEISEYYYCRYYKARRDSHFEEAAIAYLQAHDLDERKSQFVLHDLLDTCLSRYDFDKPQEWCTIISRRDTLCSELYASAAQYYARVGEYDEADAFTERALGRCKAGALLFRSPEKMLGDLDKQKELTLTYRTKKPYWPQKEEGRRAVAGFYDAKGIKYPRISKRPDKVPEDEFAPICECFDEDFDDYCAFWCAEVFSVSAARDIYQIAALRVRDGEVADRFQSFIRPWDSNKSAKKAAAKEAGVSPEVIEEAEDVDLVLSKFFAFVDSDILLSTGALGNQAKLLSRAARYSGMREIPNQFFDLLDMAADCSPEFDLANNTREFLLAHFGIQEGPSALEKAQANIELYDKLRNDGE